MRRTYYWPRMHADVKEYIDSCDSCQRITPSNQKPPGFLMPLETPLDRWNSIAIDFIVGLPSSKHGYDMIMVVVDRFTRRIRLVPLKTTATSADVLAVFLDRIACQFGFPESIVSDRDPKFVSHYWQAIMKYFKIKPHMASSRHQQTDGLAERTIRTIEDVLRHYIIYQKFDWEECLCFAEFAYNRAVQSSTQMTPFEADLGRLPNSPLIYTKLKSEPLNVPSADEVREKLEHSRNLVYDLIRDAQDRQKRFADTRRRFSSLKVGDYVLLNRHYLTIDAYRQVKLKKLLPRWIGPYKVLEIVSPVSFRLELPAKSTAHPVFHIAALKLYTEATDARKFDRPAPDIINDVEEYEVEEILGKRVNRRRTEYLVKWVGYPHDENSWESVRNLNNALDLVNEYESHSKTK